MTNVRIDQSVESRDLKSLCCQFESDCGHQIYKIDITLPAVHFYGRDWWVEQMHKWCESNDIKFQIEKWPYANEEHGWTSQWRFYNSEDAVLFSLRWVNNDWGLAHHPV